MNITGPIPEHILRLMPEVERRRLGKIGAIMPEVTARTDAKSEKELHRQIVQYCNMRGWVCFHGAMHRRTGRTEGEPDFIIALPGRVLFAECKVGSGGTSDAQDQVRERLGALGHDVEIVRSLAEFIRVCDS